MNEEKEYKLDNLESFKPEIKKQETINKEENKKILTDRKENEYQKEKEQTDEFIIENNYNNNNLEVNNQEIDNNEMLFNANEIVYESENNKNNISNIKNIDDINNINENAMVEVENKKDIKSISVENNEKILTEENKVNEREIIMEKNNQNLNLPVESPRKRVSINDHVLEFNLKTEEGNDNDEYIPYNKAKESSRTLSRPSIKSNTGSNILPKQEVNEVEEKSEVDHEEESEEEEEDK
jgi:hypothetical protein